MIKRALHHRWLDFLELGRLPGVRSHLKSANFESNAHGKREQLEPIMDGRISLDMCEWVRREYKGLRSYTLNSASACFLGDQKEDLHHSLIARLWNATPATRSRLGKYCAKDSRLTYRLMRKLTADVRLIALCRVTKCDMNTVIRRGAQIKSSVQMASVARKHGFVCPFGDKRNNYEAHFEGGLVLDRTPLFVKEKIAVLDFNALYVSIMIAFNTSWDTFIPPDQVHRYTPDDCYVTPTNDVFVRKHVREGVLAQQSLYLLNTRNGFKKQAAAAFEAGDKHMAGIYDAQQLGIKLAGNSLFGYASATLHGHLPLLAIGRSITAIGRQCIQKVIDWLHKHWPDNEVFYGGKRWCVYFAH